jgi:hypothetical protein
MTANVPNAQKLTAATVNDDDLAALIGAARDLAQSDIIGLPLKFTKGVWTIKVSKDEDCEVTPTQTFVVDSGSYAEGWYKWENKKPVFKIVGRRVDGFISPPRSALPDQDKRQWPVDKNGPKDPWQEVQLLLLKDLVSDELLTWSNSSYGGRGAIGEFLKAYVAEAKQHPGEDPVVALQSWDRPSLDWGPIPTPRLKIVGWQAFGEDRTPPGNPKRGELMRQALLALPKPSAVSAEPAAPNKTLRRGGDMNDEIPF